MHLSAKARVVAAARDRYSTVAILFHWSIAALIVVQIALGWHMGDIEGLGRSWLLQLHKSVGIAVLVLTLGRLAWRIMNPPPPHGSNLTPLEATASHWVHIGFYCALLAIPLSGWAMTSLERASSFPVFGVIPWPAFPFASALPGEVQDSLSAILNTAHNWLAWLMLGLLALHVAGALKHHFISKDPTVSRMAPGTQPGAILEPRLLAIPVVIALVAAAIYLPKLPQFATRPKVVVLAKADVYADIVGPALVRRCAGCHSDDDSKGGMSVSNYQSLMQGGRHGATIIPGNTAKSELLRRVNLPGDDKHYMPQDGKTPFSKSELIAVTWWVSQGAPKSGPVGSFKLTPDVQTALQTLIGSGDEQPALTNDEPLPTVPAVDKALIDKAVADGFIVRKAAANSNMVVVDYISPKPTTPDALADLAKFGQQIVKLNLRRAGITDAEIKTIAGFQNLRFLRLEDNVVTDAGIKDVAGLKDLGYLNLTNTKVTSAVLDTTSKMPKLKRVYVWGTAVAPDAVTKAKADRKDMIIYAGLTPKDVPVETKMLTPTN